MSLLKANAVQLGQSLTASQNFTWYQPASPDGTVRLGNGNSGSVSDVITVGTTGNLTFANSVSLSAASTKTLTLNGGAGSNGLVLDASNNVGIGTGTPGSGAVNAKFTVEGGRSVFADNSNSYAIGVRYNNSTNGFYIGSPAASTLSFSSWGGTELMRLDSSGNLGLGVTPSAWYSAAKTFQIGYAGAIYANTGVAQTKYLNNAYYNVSGNPIYLNNGYAQDFSLNNSGQYTWSVAPSGTSGNAISFTQAMTLDASGRLYVKQTSQSGNTAQRVGVTFDGSSEWGINVTTSSNSGNAVNFTNASGTQIGQIQVSSTATAYVTSSDQRLKTNITPAGSAIQSILDFPVDQFDWIESGEHQDFGAVAQKAINVIPEMVQKPEDPDEMWGIDWSKAVPRLIKTIQELSAELNELKQKVNA